MFRTASVWLSLVIMASLACRGEAAGKPNIVLIVADDLGWASVGYHDAKLKTPHIDRLVKQGVELNRHYVNPMCSTTRTSLLSGRYAARFGVTGAQNERAYPWGTVTLASALKQAGYDTALAGKWHLGSLPEWGPMKFGFDHSYGSLAGGCEPWAHRYKTGPYTNTWHRNGTLLNEEGHVTDLIAREAIGWLDGRKEKSKPFFLYVPFTAPHIPIEETQEWLSLYPDIVEESRRHYAACVSHMDDAIGRIVAALDKSGARENTLILFTSDNGGLPTARNDDRVYPNGEKYPHGPAGGFNGDLRGQKGQLYEGGIRVVAFANWPGVLKPSRCEQVIHAVDWLPTLAKLAGFTPLTDTKWDGRDVWPAVFGSTPPQPRDLYWAGVGFRARAVRSGDLKLIATGNGDKATMELFDLAADPLERKDLATERPEDVQRLRKLMTSEQSHDNEAKVTELKRR